ncbi:MAG: acetoacetate--CoA ligase [Actinobacteria bacterium]|nr:acetoacetate--CoA ligase [Actinomycetota bacterium]
MTDSAKAQWTPAVERIAKSHMNRFAEMANQQGDLHTWSITQPEQFWSLAWDACGVVGHKGERAFVAAQSGSNMSTAQFFPDASISVVENLLARTGNSEALVAIDEAGNRRVRTWDELRERVASIASALQSLGVVAGDRVAAWLPNSIEAIEVMLGAASIGAVFSSSSPDFGTNGVLDRFGQIAPKVLFAVDGYLYNGKTFDCLERLAEIRRGLPSVVQTVVVSNTSTNVPTGTVTYEQFVTSGSINPVQPMRFAFDHPWYVLYSSGTTGVPKCIVHRTGGVLLQHMKEHQLHCDIHAGDRVMYFTTTGWMMWNWLVSVLASGATAVLFDGAPTAPTMSRLFDIVDEENITLLGVSAKFIDSLRKADVQPKQTHKLGSLRTICSTGSPLAPEGFDWVYQSVKPDVHLASISGGTDLCGCFVGGNPTKPVFRGEIQGPMLGMAVDVVNEQLQSLRNTPLTPGELVCREPFPSMPIGFWNDGVEGFPHSSKPGPKFLSAYFERLSGMWAQGDFASWTPQGGMIIHGRSDTTLNPGGVRIGTAEIYRVVEQHDEVLESLVFGQDWDNDVRIVLLVRLAEGKQLSAELIADLKRRIRVACTPRHVPALVVSVRDLPRTRSNKLVELALADAVNGRPVRNGEAIANPECIAEIAAMDELRG